MYHRRLIPTDRTRSLPRRGSSNMSTFHRQNSNCPSIALNRSSSLASSNIRNRSIKRLGHGNPLRLSPGRLIRPGIRTHTRLLLFYPHFCRISSRRPHTHRSRHRPHPLNFQLSMMSPCRCARPAERRLARLTLLLAIYGNWTVTKRRACQVLHCPIVMI
jgi:hypothetical protein